MNPPRRLRPAAAALALTLLAASAARAGPPFLTDDPEPVELGHWEFYLASQWSMARHDAAGTCPHVEVNRGALTDVQLHAIVPAALAVDNGLPSRFGLGDVELGVKWRFVEEGSRRPQVGIFPLLDLPTGSQRRGLGQGSASGLLPVWLQKSSGAWLTYGGGGLRWGPDGNALVAGWLVQRQISPRVAAGVEGFLTDPVSGAADQAQLNAGLIVDFSKQRHLLMSAGPSFGGGATLQAYLAYLLTI